MSNNTKETDIIKCGKCKLNLSSDQFGTKRCGSMYKTCLHCRGISKKYRDSKQCLHNIFIYNCKTCKDVIQNKRKAEPFV